MREVKVIALVGMPGAGKGTCTDYLGEKYRLPVIHFGNMLYEEMSKRGLDNVKDENRFRKQIRDEQGPEVLAKLAAAKAQAMLKKDTKHVVLDGLYSWGEYEYLEKEFGDGLITIAVSAARQTRYQRILDRQDSHRKYHNEGQLRTREIREIEDLNKGGPIAYADFTIINETTKEDLIAQLEKVLSEIGLSN